MRFWWVNQNQTWKHERRGGYLWAPYRGTDGLDRFHWMNMEDVSIGDVIFSYAGQRIRAVSIVRTSCYPSNRPAEFGEGSPWKLQGRRIDVQYLDIEEPPALADLQQIIQQMVGIKHGPITRQGLRASQGYLYAINEGAGRSLLGEFHLESVIELGQSDGELELVGVEDQTTRQMLIDARVGQGKYREDLIAKWGSCAVTGVEDTKLLIASHVLPWRLADNSQRLDPDNGLLLSPSYDRAFDQGRISFDDSGGIMMDREHENSLMRAGVMPQARLRDYSRELNEYMHFHRNNEFRKSR